MTLAVHAITFDCADAERVAAFWAAALHRTVDRTDQGPSAAFASIGLTDGAPGSPAMMFIQVPEPRTVKNRVHLDLATPDLESEVERLLALGATRIHDKDEWGVRWTTLADPEGNEFCVAQH
jgi:predicted enzyme related to lactoylglutathione lyase